MSRYGLYSRDPYLGSKVEAVGADYRNLSIPFEDIISKHGVCASTIRAWRDRHGWPKRVGNSIPRRPRDRETDPFRNKLDRVKRWRCECLPGGRLNTEATCGSCGHIPPWAEKGAAA